MQERNLQPSANAAELAPGEDQSELNHLPLSKTMLFGGWVNKGLGFGGLFGGEAQGRTSLGMQAFTSRMLEIDPQLQDRRPCGAKFPQRVGISATHQAGQIPGHSLLLRRCGRRVASSAPCVSMGRRSGCGHGSSSSSSSSGSGRCGSRSIRRRRSRSRSRSGSRSRSRRSSRSSRSGRSSRSSGSSSSSGGCGLRIGVSGIAAFVKSLCQDQDVPISCCIPALTVPGQAFPTRAQHHDGAGPVEG